MPKLLCSPRSPTAAVGRDSPQRSPRSPLRLRGAARSSAVLSTALPLLSFPSLRGCTRGHGKARLAPVFPSEWEAKQGRRLLPLSTHPPRQNPHRF